jgi:ubiquinone/menaquinone biosynthesis C-methylase UbiE
VALIDKSGALQRLQQGEKLALELGCGPRKVDRQAIGVDLLDFDGVDVVGDVYQALSAMPDASIARVYSAHFLEHLPDLPALLAELGRVMVPGASLSIVVPHFSNPFYYSDPTHRTPFGLYTLAYFCEQSLFRRGVPRYDFKSSFTLQAVHLGFKSYPPRYLRHAFKRLIGALVNSSMFAKEFYEENLCWLLPCYELRYELRRD